MKFSIQWTTIAESIIVMMIISVWVVGMYSLFDNSKKLSDSSEYRLQAISMAREWLEAVTNIRDTNWLLFPENTTNCWNTRDYNSSCITTDEDIASGSYVIYRATNDRWMLSWATAWWDYGSGTYRNRFRVNLDGNGFYTQSWGTNFTPVFTRELQISYPADAGTPLQKMDVKSIVQWKDASGNTWHTITLDTSLTNWK